MGDDKLEEIREWFCGDETRVSAEDVFRIKWLLDEIGRLRRLFLAVQHLQSIVDAAEKEVMGCLKARVKKAETEVAQAKQMLRNTIGGN